MTRQKKHGALTGRQPRKSSRALRILLVEDHDDTCRTLARLLAHFGHQIVVADSQQSALETLQSKRLTWC